VSISSALAVAAASWGLLMSVAPALQIRAILRRRSSAGVSVGYLAVLEVGFAWWLAYGLSIGNLALVLTNGVSLVVCGTTIVVALRHRPSASLAPAAAAGAPPR